MTTEAGTREMGGSRRKEGSYPVADEDWQDGVTVAAPRFARVVTPTSWTTRGTAEDVHDPYTTFADASGCTTDNSV